MKNTREIAEEYRLKHWAEIMRERTESGMSVRSYCKSIGLHENVYYYWQRKLRIAAIEGEETGVIARKQNEATAQNSTEVLCVSAGNELSVAPGWAICEIQQETEKPKSCIKIEIGKSCITADATTDHALLAKVCGTLMTLC
jgi:transposase-like protein